MRMKPNEGELPENLFGKSLDSFLEGEEGSVDADGRIRFAIIFAVGRFGLRSSVCPRFVCKNQNRQPNRSKRGYEADSPRYDSSYGSGSQTRFDSFQHRASDFPSTRLPPNPETSLSPASSCSRSRRDAGVCGKKAFGDDICVRNILILLERGSAQVKSLTGNTYDFEDWRMEQLFARQAKM